jgi:cellulose synthase/poly-beta-1,6-N-acetylglucosamine synthase-like glycosyltransferase
LSWPAQVLNDAPPLIRGADYVPKHDDKPAVSVIMPVYNGAQSLPAAVGSVLAQTLSNLEVLIVDDGSLDDTAHIAEQFAARDPRVRVMRYVDNRGPAAARNLALEAARGVWLAPVDADDEIYPDRLRLLVEAGARANADLIADGILFQGARPHGTPPELMTWQGHGHHLEVLTAETLIKSDLPAGGRCSLGYLKPLMRRRFLKERSLRYPEDLRFAEDFHLYARALICGARFVLYPESYYIYRQTPESASRAETLLPRMARHAVTSSQRLRATLPQTDSGELRAVLGEHEERWKLLSWFEQIKRAVAKRQVRRAVDLLSRRPTGPGNIIRFAGDRARMRRQAAEGRWFGELQ